MRLNILLLLVFFIGTKAFAQAGYERIKVSVEPEVIWENGDRYFVGKVYLTPFEEFSGERLSAIELFFDFDKQFFNDEPTELGRNKDLVFTPNASEWATVYDQISFGVAAVYELRVGEISYMCTNLKDLRGQDALTLNKGVPYFWGTIKWKLLPSAPAGASQIKFRVYGYEEDGNESGAEDDYGTPLTLVFEKTIIDIEVPDDPLQGIDPPKDLAGLTTICKPEKTEVYTVTRPDGVDSCAWYLSTDAGGKDKVAADVAEIAVGAKGEEATVVWKNTTALNTYYLQVYSVKGENTSDPVHIEVQVEGFPDFTEPSSTIACQSTVLEWSSPKGEVMVAYADYEDGSHNSPYEVTTADTCHFVRYRTNGAGCKDTVDYVPEILDPQIEWVQAPPTTVSRGTEFSVYWDFVDGSVPQSCKSRPQEYTWVKPEGVSEKDRKKYPVTATAKSYEFEVYAEVDGCKSNTLTGETKVDGGGILPNASVLGGQNIACQGSGVMLMCAPTGGTEPYTYSWHETDENGAEIAASQQAWVTPSATTKYYIEVTDANGDTGSETIEITYKEVAAPAVSAGEDQAILKGTYTYLCGTLLSAGDGSKQTWYWTPAAALAGGEQNKPVAQTQALTAGQEYVAYAVDDNGCVSAPDTVTVKVHEDLADAGEPPLTPEDPDEPFEIGLNPAQITLCKNNTVQLTLKTSGIDLEGATYTWMPATGLSAGNIAEPVLTAGDGVVSGDYVLTIAKADFKITRKVSVTVNPEEAPVLQLADNRMSCTGDVVEVLADGTAPDEYVWMRDGEVIAHAGTEYTLAEAGDYHLKVYGKYTDAVCASDTLSVDVTVNQGVKFENVTPDMKVCGPAATLSFASVDPEDAAFQWIAPDRSVVSATDKSITANQSGTYYLVGGEGACSDTVKVKVVLNNVLAAAGLKSLVTSCEGTAALAFDSTTANTFVWLGSDKQEMADSRDQNPYTVSGEGYYYLALDGGNCKDTLQVGVKLNSNPVVEVQERLTACGTSLSIGAVASAGTLYWSEQTDGSDPHPITEEVTGTDETKTYYVYADAGDGCRSALTKVEVTFGAAPEVLADAVQTVCENSYELTASSTGTGGVKWYATQTSATEISPVVTGENGTSKDYWVCADDGEGCRSERQKVTVQFGVSPQLTVRNLQTTCENEIALEAATTGGKTVWKEGEKELLVTTVSGTAGETKYYQVRAEDGKCVTAWEKVEVRFGTAPVILAQTLQTTCTEEYTLAGTASAGELLWYKDEKLSQPLSSLEVKQETGKTVSSYYVIAADGSCKSEKQEIRVAFGTAPLVTAVSPQTTCETGAVLTLNATTTGGQLVWKDAFGTKLPSTTVGEAGTYYVYAVDGTCTSAEEAVEVRFGENPVVMVDPVQTSCTNEYTLEATTSGGELHWLNADGGEIAAYIPAGSGEQTYKVYAQDGSCRSEEQTFTVKFGAYPELSFDKIQSTCETSLKLQASATGGELVWKTEGGEVLAIPQVSGNPGENAVYKVQAVDGSCKSNIGTITVNFGSKPAVYAEALQTACGTTHTLQATASEGAELHWRADGSETEIAAEITGQPGETAVYWVYAEKDGCKSEEQKVTVAFGELPLVVKADPLTTCGNSIELTASVSGGEAVWTDAKGDVVTAKVVTGQPGTTYTYRVYAQDGECRGAEREIEVSFGAKPEVLVEKDITSCGEECTLTAASTDGEAEIYWLKEDRTTPVTVAQGSTGSTGRYYVYAAVSEACKSEMVPVDVHFGVSPLLTAVSPQTACDTVVVLQATATAGNLVWKNAGGGLVASPQVHGKAGSSAMYYVTAEDGACSSDTKAVKVEYGKTPELEVQPVQTVCEGDEYELQAVVTGGQAVWYQSDQTTLLESTTVNKTGEGIPGIYYVEARDGACVGPKEKVTVYFDRLPEIQANSRQTTCGNVITLEATATAGETVWTDQDGEVLPIPQATGNAGDVQYYYVYAQDGSCESAKTLVEVAFGTAPEIQTETVQTACGDTHLLTATASDGQIHWLESADATEEMTSLTVSAEGAESRTYYVYAENGEGCESEKVAVTVLFGTSPMVTAVSPQTTCGETIKLSASTTAGELVWKDEFGNLLGSTQLTQTTPGEATYYVYAQDGSCVSATKEVTVKFGSMPEVIAEAAQSTCGNEYTLSATATQGVLRYVMPGGMESGSGVVTGNDNETKTYRIYAQGEPAACKSEPVEVTVTFGSKPTIHVDQDQSTCEDVLQLQATATGGEVFWMDSERKPLLLPQVTKEDGDSYIVYAASSREETTCKSQEVPVNVAFGARPEVTVAAMQTSCTNEYVLQATASDGAVLHWMSGEKALTGEHPTVTGELNTTATYWVYASKGECSSEKKEVTVAFGVAPVVTVAGLQTSCETSLTLTASATAGTLKWQKEGASVAAGTGDTHTITGIKGTTQKWYVYAEDGTCTSEKAEVTASFGTKPQVLAEALQTTCGTAHTLTALPTEGELHWSDASKNPLTSIEVQGLPNEAADYYVYAQKGTDESCKGEELKVTVVFGTAPQVTVLSPQTVCGQDGGSTATIRLEASTTGGTLIWRDEAGNELATATQTAGKNTTKKYYVQAEDNGCLSLSHEVVAKFGAVPEVSAEPLQTACGTTLELQAQASAGELIWLKGSTVLPSPVVKAGEGDTYTVRAKDGSCQSTGRQVKVVFETDPVVTVVSPQTTCGKLIELKATTTGGELVWENANGEELKLTQVAGSKNTDATYFVYARGEACRSAKEMVQVRFEAVPEVIAETEQTACGEEYVLQATATAGELIWLDSDGSTPLSSATVRGTAGESKDYYVYAKDGECEGEPRKITVHFGSAPVVTLAALQTTCEGQLTLQASATGGELEWRDEEGNILPTPAVSGVAGENAYYYVTAVDGACRSTEERTEVRFGVNPEVIADALQTTCGTEYELRATPTSGKLVWFEANGTTPLKSAKVQKPAGGNTATYYVQAENGKCAGEKQKITVAFGSEPVVTVLTPQTTCGNRITLKASATGGEIVWTDKDDKVLTIPVVEGTENTSATYYVKAQEEGCESKPEEVTVYFGRKPVVNVQEQQTSCGKELELVATASGGDVYWLKSDKSVLTSTHVQGENGTKAQYYVYAGDGSCYSDTVGVEVKFGSAPQLVVVSPQTACGGTVTLKAEATGGEIVWTRADGSEVIPPVVKEGDEETYYVQAVDGTCVSNKETVAVKFGVQPKVFAETLQTACDTVLTLKGTASDGMLVWKDEEGNLLENTTVHGTGVHYYYAQARVGSDCVSDEVKVKVAFGSNPVLNVLATQTACETSLNLKASASGGDLIWKDASGKTLDHTLISRKGEEKTAEYTVYAQDGECRSPEEQVQVIFNEKPVVSVETLQVTCGTEYELQAAASGGQIHWIDESMNEISPVVTGNAAKDVKVYVYAEDGKCSTIDDPIGVTVKFGQKPAVPADILQQYACSTPYKLQGKSVGGQLVWERNGKEIIGNVVDLTEGENIFWVHAVDENCSPASESVTEKVIVTLSGRPELALGTVHCTGDTLFAEETTGIGASAYRWWVNGTEQTACTDAWYVFAQGGEYEVKVVAETDGACVSDTVSGNFTIAEPLKLAWDPEPAAAVVYGNNVSGCVKVAVGEETAVEKWNWLSPAAEDITGKCFNITATEQDYTFKVYAQDAQGCVSDTLEARTEVTGFGELDLTLEPTSGTEVCEGGSALMTAIVEGGKAPYTYEWYVKDAVTPVRKVTSSSVVDVCAVAPTEAVTYVLKVRDAQTTPAVAKKEISLTIRGGATLPVADAGPDMTIRRNLQTVLKGGAGAETYSWLPVGKLNAADEENKQYPLTAKLSTSQKYQLYVTDAAGCVSQPDETVVYVLPLDGTEEDIPTPPSGAEGLELAIQPAADTLCLGAERWIAVKDLIGNLSGSATYTWVPETGLTLNGKRDSALFKPTAAGDYTFVVTVEDGANKMALRSNIHVKDADAPVFDLAVTGNCQQDTVKMVYAGGSVKAGQVSWKVKGTAVSATDDYYVLTAAGNYTVEVVAGNDGCYAASKSVEVTVNEAPQITALTLADSCGQAVVEVEAEGAAAGYTWTATPEGQVDAEHANRYVIAEAGPFEVTVKAANEHCTVARTLKGEVFGRPELKDWVIEPADGEKNTAVQAAVAVQTGTGTPAYTYHWLQPDGAKEVTTGNYTVDPAELAAYTFEVYASDAKGCVSDTLKKTVKIEGGDVKVEIASVYGDAVCEGGAAMLVAHAQGMEAPCVFEWMKKGSSKWVRSGEVASVYDTLWVKEADIAEYVVNVKKESAGNILGQGTYSSLTKATGKTAPVVTVEKDLTIADGGHTVLLSSVSGGTPAYRWHWSPADRLVAGEDTLPYPMTVNLTEKQVYELYVTDANSCVSVPETATVSIHEEGLCVEVEPQDQEICRSNTLTMVARVDCGMPEGYLPEYAWLPAEQSGLLSAADKDTVVFTPAEKGEYTWLVKVTNGGITAVARTTVTVRDADAPVLALEGHSDCVNDTLIVKNSGETAEKYVWTADGLEMAETGDRFVLADKSIRQVEVYAQAANGCKSDVWTKDMTLGIVPEVEIADGSFVNYPDSVTILQVKQNEELLSGNYDFSWTTTPDGKIDGVKDQLSARTVAMTEDVKFRFEAVSKDNPLCRAADSVTGYLIPKAAPVEIDKDENTGRLQLTWKKEELGLADSVRVMNIKWDGYAVLSDYKPEAMVAGDMEKYIIDSSKDTLEFFYINASRYIREMNKSYYSFASDTVGYMRQWIYGNANAATQQNFIAYPFEMPLIKKTGDIIKYGGLNSVGKYAISTVSYWDGAAWKAVSATSSNIIGNVNNVEVVGGSVYRVILRNDETIDLLFYGKLPQKFSYSISVGKQNFVLVPLTIGYINTRFEIGDLIPGIKNVGSFTFSEQGWKNSAKSKAGIWGGTTGDFNVRVWRALRIILDDSATSVIWTY